jgi:hypothetical protein
MLRLCGAAGCHMQPYGFAWFHFSMPAIFDSFQAVAYFYFFFFSIP